MRKTLTITIDADGRDKGKVFVVTEMPAVQAERWALRAIFALMNTGADIPDDIAQMGMAGISRLGLSALMQVPYAAAEPLLAEMLECVKIIPDPAKPSVTRAPVEQDFEEVSTLLRLRKEVFALHTDFFTNAAKSTSV